MPVVDSNNILASVFKSLTHNTDASICIAYVNAKCVIRQKIRFSFIIDDEDYVGQS